MTVRVYRWDDSSAPVLSGASAALTDLLSACLVSGYGSKAAAGWSQTVLATGVKVYTNAGSGKSIKVTHNSASQYARVIGSEAADGVSGLFFPTEAQQSGGLYWWLSSTADSTARPWLMVATDKFFHLWIGNSVPTSTGLVTSANMNMYAAGDITPAKGDDAFHFLLVGAAAAAANSSAYGGLAVTITGTTTGHFMARSYSQAGGAVAVGKVADYAGMNGGTAIGTSGITYPDPVGGGMLLAPVRVVESSCIRGVVPGLWCPLHSLPGNPGDTFSGTGALSGKTFILLDGQTGGSRCRVALETSNTW